MTARLRRVALALIRHVRQRLRPPLPAGSIRHDVGSVGSGVYWREPTAEERAEMQATDPRPAREPRRWLDRGPGFRW